MGRRSVIITPCGSDYVSACASSAVISACGDLDDISCICGPVGQASIESIAGPCLFASCPITEILALGISATGACNQWLSTAGGPTNATAYTSAVLTSSTTLSSSTKISSPGTGVTNSQPTPTAPLSTSAGKETPSQGLPVGVAVGIGLGVFAILCLVLSVFFFQRFRAKGDGSQTAHELGTDMGLQELPGEPYGVERRDMIDAQRRQLAAFKFPFQERDIPPVEADSQSVRAQSRGRVVGTETTAFGYESQKVLLIPGLRPGSSRASSVAPSSANGSVRRINPET